MPSTCSPTSSGTIRCDFVSRPPGAPDPEPLFDEIFDPVRSQAATRAEIEGSGDRVAIVARAIRALWQGRKVTLEQPYYSLVEAETYPLPPRGGLPLVIGGRGEKRTLRVVAECADEWNVTRVTPEAYPAKRAVLEEHCRAVGRDPARIARSLMVPVVIGRGPAEVVARRARIRARFPGDDARVRRMSLIDEDGGRSVRMAHLAVVGSHAVNGVAAIHTRLLRSSLLRDFHDLWPERFSNKTNGVSPRRFIAVSNPGLRRLVTRAIGERWLTDLSDLARLEPLAAVAPRSRAGGERSMTLPTRCAKPPSPTRARGAGSPSLPHAARSAPR